MSFLRSAAVLAALVFSVLPLAAQTEGSREELVVTTDAGQSVFQVEIADEPGERSMGLMHRRVMGDDEGMLFDLGSEQPASFWMRNTYISLDMLFIKADGTVESIAERTTPLSEKSIPSKGPVRYVLEINGGLSDALGIEPGDAVSGPAIDARP
jgi:uncharacterized membrane protein (UPF0127 family)